MGATSSSALLRPDLLAGKVVLVSGSEGSLGGDVAAACLAVGAIVARPADGGRSVDPFDEEAVEEAVDGVLRRDRRVDVLVNDAAGPLATRGLATVDALRHTLEPAWIATRAVVNRAFLAGDGAADRPAGKVVNLAPRPDAGSHAGAARAALENMARTLSIEWSRHGIRVVTIAPGAGTSTEEVGALVAYLASPAGDYFSGCVLGLGEAQPA